MDGVRGGPFFVLFCFVLFCFVSRGGGGVNDGIRVSVVRRRPMVIITAERVAVMCCGGVWYSSCIIM